MKLHHIFFIVVVTIILAACAIEPKDGPPSYDVDVSKIPNAKPKPEPKSAYGNLPSYKVLGQSYHVLPSAKNYCATGIASWYGTKFDHHLTSNHEVYDLYKMTAAHKTLPIPCYAKVTNLENHKQVIVKVNDRGPFEKNRLIDLSYVAAKKLGIVATGTGLVRVETITPGQPASKSTHNHLLAKHTNHEIYLQVGAYSNQAYAKQMNQRLNSLIPEHCQVLANHKNKNSRPFYLVQIGPIKNITKADELTTDLEVAGFPEPAMVVR